MVSMEVLFWLARVAVGLAMAAHGAQKLFGWFGGHGIAGTGGYLEGLGFRPGRLFALGLGSAEFTSGLLTALGLLGPVGPALMIAVMTAAALVAHRGKGFFAMTNGPEVPFLYSAVALVVLSIGPSAVSLDELLHLRGLWAPEVVWMALVAGVIGGLAGAGLRRPGEPRSKRAAAACSRPPRPRGGIMRPVKTRSGSEGIRESSLRLVERLPGPRGGQRKQRHLRLLCARFDDGWCWSPESASPRAWQGPFPTLGAAEEAARVADGRVAGGRSARRQQPGRARRHAWREATGLEDLAAATSRRCSVCHLAQTRTSPLVLWPSSGFCPGPARLVTPKR